MRTVVLFLLSFVLLLHGQEATDSQNSTVKGGAGESWPPSKFIIEEADGVEKNATTDAKEGGDDENNDDKKFYGVHTVWLFLAIIVVFLVGICVQTCIRNIKLWKWRKRKANARKEAKTVRIQEQLAMMKAAREKEAEKLEEIKISKTNASKEKGPVNAVPPAQMN